MKTLITGAFPLTPEQKQALEARGMEIVFHPDERADVPQPEQYEAVVCNGLFLYHPIERFAALRVVQLTSAGYDRMPMEYAKAHGIRVYNARGVYSVPMAEFAICGILQLYKQAAFFHENQKRHVWQKHRGLLELSGKAVCILGTGDVGCEIAKRLRAFGCRVIGVNRTVRELPDFDAVLPLRQLAETVRYCDVLVVSAALTEETHGLVNADMIRNLKRGAVLVNVSRGALVDEAALLSWLQSDPSSGAVLDVFETEPLPEQSPLWDMQNVILTPHNSFVSEENPARLWEKIWNIMGAE